MATETKETKARKPRARRNYAKEFERLEVYLETVIHIKIEPPPATGGIISDWVSGELKAYRDIQDYIGVKTKARKNGAEAE